MGGGFGRCGARALLAAGLLLVPATPAFADDPPEKLPPPVVLAGAEFGSPTRTVVTGGLLIGPSGVFRPGAEPDSGRAGFLVSGGIGAGGFHVGSGVSALVREGPIFLTGFDGQFTLIRTGHNPRTATPDSTYIGGEAGLVISCVRASAGIAHRIAGPPGPKTTMLTWSIGFQIPIRW